MEVSPEGSQAQPNCYESLLRVSGRNRLVGADLPQPEGSQRVRLGIDAAGGGERQDAVLAIRAPVTGIARGKQPIYGPSATAPDLDAWTGAVPYRYRPMQAGSSWILWIWSAASPAISVTLPDGHSTRRLSTTAYWAKPKWMRR